MLETAGQADVAVRLVAALTAHAESASFTCEITGLKSRQVRIRRGDTLVLEGPLWAFPAPSRRQVEADVVHCLVSAEMADARPEAGVVLLLDRLTDGHVEHLMAMLKHLHLERRPVLLVGKNGLCWAHVPALGIRSTMRQVAGLAAQRLFARPQAQLAWTARQQWIARALALHPLIQAGWWRWPGDDPAPINMSATALAHVSGISLASVGQAIQAMQGRGWIDREPARRTQVSDPFGMIHDLLTYAAVRPARSTPARILQAPTAPDEVIAWLQNRPLEKHHHWAITGWHALRARGMVITSGVSEKVVEIVTDREDIGIWRAVPCDMREANVVFRQGIQVDTQGGMDGTSILPIADPILATMHVAAYLENGHAQVEHTETLMQRAYQKLGGQQ